MFIVTTSFSEGVEDFRLIEKNDEDHIFTAINELLDEPDEAIVRRGKFNYYFDVNSDQSFEVRPIAFTKPNSVL